MSVVTATQLNYDRLRAALPPGTVLFVNGAYAEPSDPLLPTTASKTLTATGATDAQIQSAVTIAAGQFADYATNRQTLLANARQARTDNAAFLAAPAVSQTLASLLSQVTALTKQVNGLIRLLVGDFTDTT